MKSSLIGGLASLAALTAFAGPAAAQQIPPVTDSRAAAECAPSDMAAAVACLERWLKPEVKAEIARSANPEALMPSEVYVGLWMRNNWGFWTGSPIAQWMLAKRVTQPEAQSNRIIQAYWLKTKGCTYDLGDVGFVVAGMRKAAAGADPCAVTLAEATAAGRSPMGAAAAAGGRAGRGGAAAGRAGRGAADQDDDEGAED